MALANAVVTVTAAGPGHRAVAGRRAAGVIAVRALKAGVTARAGGTINARPEPRDLARPPVDLPGSVPVEIVDVIEARGGTVEEIVVVVVHAAVDFRIASGGNRHLPCRKSLSR